MKKTGFSTTLIFGFALFAIFFGAGNLVFPPLIGMASGNAWGTGIFGMSISAIVLPILAMIAVNNMGDDFSALTLPVAPWFFKAFIGVAALTTILLSVPRQGGVAIESGLFGLFPFMASSKIWTVVALLFYFGITFAVVAKKSNVVDIVGKFLTPALLVILLFIVIVAFVKPIGTPGEPTVSSVFANAFVTGYQTGDVMTGLILAGLFVASLRQVKNDNKFIRKTLISAAIIAGIGLVVIYAGLMYLGASGSTTFPADTDATVLLIAVIEASVGKFGLALLCIGIFLACLTTSIGVVSATSDMVVKITNGKIKYFWVVVACCVFGVIMGTVGVSNIIFFSYPILYIIYPMAIAVTLLGVLKRFIPNHGVWKGAVLAAGIVGLYDAIALLNMAGLISVNFGGLATFYSKLPLAGLGVAWIVPAIVGGIIGGLIVKLKGSAPYPMITQDTE